MHKMALRSIYFGDKNARLELKPVRYQFADFNNKYDANWMLIFASVDIGGGAFEATAPCLTTTDLSTLRSWFLDPNRSPVLSFWEPELSFRFCSSRGKMSFEAIVRFGLLSPQLRRLRKEIIIEMNLTVDQVELLSETIKEWQMAFPPR